MWWNIPQPHMEIFPLHVVKYSPATYGEIPIPCDEIFPGHMMRYSHTMWWNFYPATKGDIPTLCGLIFFSHKRNDFFPCGEIFSSHIRRSPWGEIFPSHIWRYSHSMWWNIPQPHKEIFLLHVVEYSPAHSIWWDRVESGDLLSLSVFNVGYLAGKCGNRGFHFGGSVYVRTEFTTDRTFIKCSSWKLNNLLLKSSRYKEKHFSQMVILLSVTYIPTSVLEF